METKVIGLVVMMMMMMMMMMAPTALAARNEVVPFVVDKSGNVKEMRSNNNVNIIRNPLAANIFMVASAGKSGDGENCISSGGFCMFNPMDCCGSCGCLYPIGVCFGSGC